MKTHSVASVLQNAPTWHASVIDMLGGNRVLDHYRHDAKTGTVEAVVRSPSGPQAIALGTVDADFPCTHCEVDPEIEIQAAEATLQRAEKRRKQSA